MSFECKFYDKGFCIRLEKTCKPGQNGCVLFGKVKFISPSPEPDTKSLDSSQPSSTDTEHHQPH